MLFPIRSAPRPSKVLLFLALLLGATILFVSLHHYDLYGPSPPVIRSLPEERDSSGYSAAERLIAEGIRSGACDNWQPPTGNDTRVKSGCWKDKWHAQLTNVLDNWQEYSDLS